MTEAGFQSLAAIQFAGAKALHRYTVPTVFKGLAARWPAVQRWNFTELASRVPDLRVKLVVGNREAGNTHFIEASLRSYFESLQCFGDPVGPALYLKEFDLLNAVPALRCAAT